VRADVFWCFFILFVAMDFRIEAPLLLKTRKSVKEYFENFANEKKFTANGASYGSSFVSPR